MLNSFGKNEYPFVSRACSDVIDERKSRRKGRTIDMVTRDIIKIAASWKPGSLILLCT
jgi:hypothetical protein